MTSTPEEKLLEKLQEIRKGLDHALRPILTAQGLLEDIDPDLKKSLEYAIAKIFDNTITERNAAWSLEIILKKYLETLEGFKQWQQRPPAEQLIDGEWVYTGRE